MKLSEYEQQAVAFCNKYQVTITSRYLGHEKYFKGDKVPRAKFEVTISRPDRKPMTFIFGQSLVNSYQGFTQGQGFIKTGRTLKDGTPVLSQWRKLPQNFDYEKVATLLNQGDSFKATVKVTGKLQDWTIRACHVPPSAYDILATLTKSDPGTFEDFCWNFGYSTDSKEAEKTFHAVDKEWHEVSRLFNDCLEELQEIN